MTAVEKIENLIKENGTLTAERKFILRVNAAVEEYVNNSLTIEELQKLEEEANTSLYKSIMKSLDK
ncbi:MAG: hypothetical protein IJY25_04565 [Bacilli bacterium]|nr:hypothetical protein [Bacilli bacterium]